jgi:hypothetical protein
MKFKDFFVLNLRKTVIIIAIWIVVIFFHNLLIRFFKIEELFSFFIAVVLIPVYFIISFIYTVFINKKAGSKRRKR